MTAAAVGALRLPPPAAMQLRAPPEVQAVDLFCGVGGWSCGLKQAGIDVLRGVDFDNSLKDIYTANIFAPMYSGAVETAPNLRQYFARGAWRVLVASPPCQPFTKYPTARKSNAGNSARIDAIAGVYRHVEEVAPHFIALENIQQFANAPQFVKFCEFLRRRGYHVAAAVHNAADFGVAQTRRRLIMVAARGGMAALPAPTTAGKPVTAWQAIGHLPPANRFGAPPTCDDPAHVARALSPINRRRVEASPPGGGWRDLPRELQPARFVSRPDLAFDNCYGRVHEDLPALTITGRFRDITGGRFVHPREARALSIREGALLQGFPADYFFGDPPIIARAAQWIGNAVPPPVARAVGEVIMAQVTARELRGGIGAGRAR